MEFLRVGVCLRCVKALSKGGTENTFGEGFVVGEVFVIRYRQQLKWTRMKPTAEWFVCVFVKCSFLLLCRGFSSSTERWSLETKSTFQISTELSKESSRTIRESEMLKLFVFEKPKVLFILEMMNVCVYDGLFYILTKGASLRFNTKFPVGS